VLLPSDTHRKPITSIAAVLLPFVTYLLTLPHTPYYLYVGYLAYNLFVCFLGPFTTLPIKFTQFLHLFRFLFDGEFYKELSDYFNLGGQF
jgi:hypothetical protein